MTNVKMLLVVLGVALMGMSGCASMGSGGSSGLGCTSGNCYVLSKNAGFTTDDRVYTTSDTLNMYVFSDAVDPNDMKKHEYELKDADKNKVKATLNNNGDGSFTQAYDLSNLPSNLTSWSWKGKVEDNNKNKYQATDSITVNP